MHSPSLYKMVGLVLMVGGWLGVIATNWPADMVAPLSYLLFFPMTVAGGVLTVIGYKRCSGDAG